MPRQKAIKDKKGKYINPIPTPMAGFKETPDIFKRYRKSDPKLRKPTSPIPVSPMSPGVFNQKPSPSLVLYWMGHTSLLMELGGRRYIIDPVLSERASMIQSVGPKRMHPAPIAISDLKNIDAVILSHDHYDHMDKNTMKALAKTNALFYVPCGVGKILTGWGAKKQNIFELNWWDTIKDGPNELIATPARHFSGRGLFNRNTTLWASWCIINPDCRVYFGGDSGIMPNYSDIGEAYGPFDLTIMPIGAYDVAWHGIHTDAIEAAEAHVALKGKKMLPVHWATFDLSLHPWGEPIEQLLKAADRLGIELVTPMVGEKLTLDGIYNEHWWE